MTPLGFEKLIASVSDGNCYFQIGTGGDRLSFLLRRRSIGRCRGETVHAHARSKQTESHMGDELKALRLAATTALGAALYCMAVTAQTQLHLMPQPAQVSFESGSLALDSTFAVEVPGKTSIRLTSAIDRAVRRIEMETGLRHAGPGVAAKTRLVVRAEHSAAPVQTLDEDESYFLHVTAAGAEIDAATELGAMHGLETLIQLVQPRQQRVRHSRRQHSRCAKVSLAWIDDRLRTALRAGGGDQAQPGRHGSREAECLPLAPDGGPGISH